MQKGKILKTIIALSVFFFLFILSGELKANNVQAIYASMTSTTKDVVIAGPVTVASIDGVDNGSTEASTTNTAKITVTTGGSITVNAGGTLVAGTIAITGTGNIAVSGGVIKANTPIYIKDGDADGWALSFASTSFATATAAGSRRLGLMDSYSVADCNDATTSLTNTCYSYAQSAYYAYAQSAYYAYAQSAYYAYAQSAYYGYSQGIYYSYSQSSYYGYGQSYYSSCFMPGTKVLMADGSYKNIEDVKNGDMVLSYNVTDGTSSPEKVFRLLVHRDIPGGYLVINDDLKVTANHMMWSVDKNLWVQAGTLKVGDKLLSSDGTTITVSSIEHKDGVDTVYNLSLMGPNHTYFADGVLVHNWKL